MRAIRIAALVAVVIVAGAGAARAQAPQGGRGRGMNVQMNGIELTEAQKAKLDEIQKKYQPEMMALRDQMMNGGDRAELMKKGMALSDRSAADIRAILTPDQQVVFDKNMAERKARMEQRERQGPPAR
jgi:Spy/CpxP family protein refolding chaperone